MDRKVMDRQISITRRFEFCAGHRIFRPDWSDAKNSEVFGLCSNPEGHGHNYTLEVTVTGRLDPETGMIMNLRQLKTVVNEQVILEVDHKNLNRDVSWLKGVIPTTEMFADKLWARIEGLLAQEAPGVLLSGLVLHETPNNKVVVQRGSRG
jgi:6-pyruvoyltetrahydropterin/6-carboxytetrahydropterin synthase